LIVNFDAGVVTGFTGITAHIEEVNTNPVSFKGTTTHSSGVEWSVRGRIDRITGSLGATVTWFNRRTNDLMSMNYELICKPTWGGRKIPPASVDQAAELQECMRLEHS
jgi:hypothetical protein